MLFQSLIKDVIMFKDTLLNNNELSNKFVTNLESCKKFKKQRVTLLLKTISFAAKTNKVL